MNYAAIKNCDIANGPGVRVSLFVSGCRHHCKDCFNPETWDFACGEPFDEAVMDIEKLANGGTSGGGSSNPGGSGSEGGEEQDPLG